MRYINEPMFNVAVATALINSGAVDVSACVILGVQAVFTDNAAAGTLKVQVSNDLAQQASQIVNWSDFPGASVAVAGGVAPYLRVVDFVGQWGRLVWTPTAAVGTFTARLKSIGY